MYRIYLNVFYTCCMYAMHSPDSSRITIFPMNIVCLQSQQCARMLNVIRIKLWNIQVARPLRHRETRELDHFCAPYLANR